MEESGGQTTGAWITATTLAGQTMCDHTYTIRWRALNATIRNHCLNVNGTLNVCMVGVATGPYRQSAIKYFTF